MGGNTYTLGESSPVFLGRRCAGICSDGNPEVPYSGLMDEVHLRAGAELPDPSGFAPPYEAISTDDTVFLFSMNEGFGGMIGLAGAPLPVLDRGPDARHGLSEKVELVVLNRSGCIEPLDYPPTAASLITSPADHSFYPGSDLFCDEDAQKPSMDPEGYEVTNFLEWKLDGVHESEYDGVNSIETDSFDECISVDCTLRSMDPKGNESIAVQPFYARHLESGGLSIPPTTVRAIDSAKDALSPLIDALGQSGWTLSFWYRFAANPSGDIQLVVGDDPEAGSTEPYLSWISFRPQMLKEIDHIEGETTYYRYRCGIRFEAKYSFGSIIAVEHDHFVPNIDEVLPSDQLNPCVTEKWTQFVVMRRDLEMWILKSDWNLDDIKPTEQDLIWEGEDQGNNLVLPFADNPTIVARGFGDTVLLDELHIATGLQYAPEGGVIPLVPHEPGLNTRLLWNMEPAADSESVVLDDRGPYAVVGTLDDTDVVTLPGIKNACEP